MNVKVVKLLVGMIGVLTASILFVSNASAALEDITVMALGPMEGRAVIKTSEGKMQVLKVGDAVPGSDAVVIQILSDRLVVEETSAGEPPAKQPVWIYKPTKPGAKSRVQRLDLKALSNASADPNVSTSVINSLPKK